MLNKTPWHSIAIFIILFYRFSFKTVHPFRRNFLVVLPPPTLYKVETRKNSGCTRQNIVCGVRGGGWTCVHGKPP